MFALPCCKMSKDIKDVQHFIRNRKGVEYYLYPFVVLLQKKLILHEKFGGISRAFSVGLLVLMNSYFGMKWVYCV